MFVEGGLHPEQIRLLRKMSLQRRLDLVLAAMESIGDLRSAMLRAEHPTWSEVQVRDAMREEMRNAAG